MKDFLVTMLVLMAGAFWIYALRLIWLRKRAARNEDEPALFSSAEQQPATVDEPSSEPTTSSASPLVAAKRIALEDFESVPEPFTGAFHSLLNKFVSDTWLAVGFVVVTLAIVTLLTNFVKPAVLFLALQIPLLVACSYVVSPDPNVARRLPFTWSITALLALFIYLLQAATVNSVQEALNNAAGLMAWLLIVYWGASAASWSVNLARRQKDELNRVQALELFALLCATWGAVFEVASLLVWIVISLWRDLAIQVPSVHMLFSAVSLMKTQPALRFLPLEIVALALLTLGALRVKDDHYVPRSLDEFLPVRGASFFAPFVLAFRIPVWIVVVLLEFAAHFSRLMREVFMDFMRSFIARFAFIMIGFALAPLLFYAGQMLMLNVLHLTANYFDPAGPYTEADILTRLALFFLINSMALASLCLYVLAVPLLAARYRRVPLQNLTHALRQELFVQGKPYVLALGQTFSLLGILAFAIPVVSLLPGKPDFGIFSLLYTVIVLAGFSLYVTARDNEEEVEEEEQEDFTPESTEPEESASTNSESNPEAPVAAKSLEGSEKNRNS